MATKQQVTSTESSFPTGISLVQREGKASPSPAAGCPPSQLVPSIAANIRRLRHERGLPLRLLASSSGLSDQQLEALEAGDDAPSIRTLWSLATALGVPFSSLLQGPAKVRPEPRKSVGRVAGRPIVRAAAGSARRTELYELTLAGGESATQPAGDPETVESLLVTKGQVTVHFGGQAHTLSEGETVTISGNLERHYLNVHDQPSVVYIKVSPAEGG